ncbi:DNA repair protein RecO [Desulfamplus magnetovallimortis]|nr:DNA repair protein RecO [Desulfamplus magnetovallimortis]
MKSFSTDAILLKRIEYGDYDLIITYFTRSMGKISVMAKNAKKSMKRFAGALDPFIAMNIECSWPKRKNALPILNGLELENPFAHIRTCATKTGYASYWLEMINSWMEEGRPDDDLYELIYYVLESLNAGHIPAEVLSLLFQIRFMAISGFTPNITSCGDCGVSLDEIHQQMVIFDLKAGKLVCNKCCSSRDISGDENGVLVSKGTLKQLSWMNTNDIRRAERLKFSVNALREGENLLEGFIPCHIGRNLRSLIFLKRIRRSFS